MKPADSTPPPSIASSSFAPRSRGPRRHHILWAAAALALPLLGVIGVAVASRGARTRLELVGLKLAGALPAVRTRELVELLARPRGFDLPALSTSHNPYASLYLPDQFAARAQDGARIFAERCAQCHGARAEGGHGPSLVAGPRRRSGNDWAAFRVLQDGVTGSAMRPTGLSFTDSWNVIGYLRLLQRAAGTNRLDSSGPSRPPLDSAEIAGADTSSTDWLTYTGGYSARRNRAFPELTEESVSRLRLAWVHQFSDDPSPSQSTPIATRGLVLVTSAGEVTALDQRTGTVVWRFRREPPVEPRLCCTRANRGVAVYGHSVFVGTLDARLLALDITTGRLQWEVEVGRADEGFSITNAPVVVEGRLIVGVGGGDLGARGFIDAYDPATGRRIWRFHTIPGPGEPGRESWAATGPEPAGGATWTPGAYDPDQRLLFWGVGNPAPALAADVRPGDNLYTNSVVALDIETGKLRWSYQFTPNDAHDWDATQTPILVDREWQGRRRQLMLWANRNAFFYVLDRATGELLRVTPFTRQTWNYGFDARGRPKVRPSSLPSIRGAVVYPLIAGATSWWPAAFSDGLGLMFVAVQEGGSIYFRDSSFVSETGQFVGGRTQAVPDEERPLAVVALDVASGVVRWKTRSPEHQAETMGGLLAIGDRIVLGGQSSTFFALDAATGRRIWQANLGASIRGAPIVFRTDGKPRLAITAGSALFVFDVPESLPGE